MCGISGLFDTRGKQDYSRDLISRINDIQLHRGPDEAGIHLEPGLALGHRRLSIIDLATGQQPLVNEDGSVCVVFNGEIYNFVELKKELESLGYAFKTESDTEVILAAYDKWGEDFQFKLNGMWALAIWDGHERKMFVSRDRFGVKPMIYLFDGKRFAFASEMKAFLALDGFRAEYNPAVLANSL
ncbi:MAG: asparagine synthetase B, partial [Anaerolineales bacterium]|nr:asparagine synthetase B [Anaerolineales bacterium]